MYLKQKNSSIMKFSEGKSTLLVYLPLWTSLFQVCTTALACFLWCISHKDSVWTLCCVLERSLSFFSKVLGENDVIFWTWMLKTTDSLRMLCSNHRQPNWDRLQNPKKKLLYLKPQDYNQRTDESSNNTI